MSFIAKNPLSIPNISSDPPIPQKGTRGIFAKDDGWYEIDDAGIVKKIANASDINKNLSDAKDYADSKATAAETAAKSYADTQDSKTLSDAKSYTDKFAVFPFTVNSSERVYLYDDDGLIQSAETLDITILTAQDKPVDFYISTGDTFSVPADTEKLRFDFKNGEAYKKSRTDLELTRYTDLDWFAGSETFKNYPGYLVYMHVQDESTVKVLYSYTAVVSVRYAVSQKVDKIDGKGLSSNDFTDLLKEKVESIDKKLSENLATAKTYTDTKDAETLSAAKTYADKKLGENLEMTSRVHFGDYGSLPGATGGISRIKFYANGYPTIESGSPLSVSIYNGSAFLASVSAPVGFGGADYLDCDAVGNVAVSWMRGDVQMKMLEADDFIRKMAEADSVIIYDSNAEMTYADVTYTATVSAKLDSEIERAKSAESEVLENAKSYADTKAAAAEENAKTYGNQTFAGALKGEKLGSIMRLDDVSALDRRLDTVVSSKNIIPYPYAETTKTVKGLNFTDNGDGSVTVNGTATADAAFYLKRTSDEALPRGTYFLSGCPKGGAVGTYNIQPRIDGVFNSAKYDVGSGSLITAKTAIDALVISVKSGTVCNNLVFRPQLELGTSSTAYTKHVSDLSGVSLKKFGKNLFHCYGISANSIENPGASCALSNIYGTTIDKTALSSASDVLTVTQTEHPNSTNLSSYTNGFFCIGLSDMIVGQNYTLSFTFNKTDDPLSAMTEFKLQAYLNGSKSVPWQKVSPNRFSISFTWEVNGSRPNARYIEVRLSGMSGTFSAFQLEPLSTASAYVPWSAPETYTVGADGTVQNLSANEDVTTLVNDNEGTVLKTKYSRDLNAAFNAETLEGVKSYVDKKDAETLESAKVYTDTKAAEISAGSKTDVSALQNDIAELKEDLSNKITKFYASNQGEIHITDSDNGKIQYMMIYGKSSQDGTPTPENPVEIKSVVNPVVKLTNEDGLKVQSVTLNNITLNAIPVKSGGNVTIDGQQYVADYVDVERGKVIRNILKWRLADLKRGFNNNNVWHMNIPELGIDGSKIGLSNMFKIQNGKYSGVTTSELYIALDGKVASLNMRGMTDAEFKKWLIEKNPEVYNVLTVAEEIPITLEEALALKQLITYYPVTNVSVNSGQLDGVTVFNYPISMANGWNYVKQQLNDNRYYIYDMDLQSAEAYVNSEYAVALIELEV